MEINYRKNNNKLIFDNFHDKELLNMKNCQNYIPLYNNFFTLNDKNYDLINLNNEKYLYSLKEKKTENIFSGSIKNENQKLIETTIFFKLSPLLDPFKYMAGKYQLDNNLLKLPKLNDSNIHFKINDINNSAYVDGFFTYLTSQLLNRMNFVHGLDFYGSFLGIKNNYHLDIGDDIDMLQSNDFFHENTNKLFSFINTDHEMLFNEDSRKNKKILNFGENIDTDVLNIEDIIEDNNTQSNIFNISNNENNTIKSEVNEGINESINETINNSLLVYEYNKSKKSNLSNLSNSSSSECSSRSSNTEKSKENLLSDDDDDDDSNNEDDSDESSSDIESIMVSINEFPVQIIALEKCFNTLDYLFTDEKLGQEELSCIVIQILMTLITYQKMFNLTHNDLHTNNIMYVETEKKFLYYKVNNKHYKIKTFGKIFKIIDFGRAIYRYKNKLIYSDSFHSDGDANTQYNSEPYFNKDKARLEPNNSFDLCRLGCSIYDFISEKYEDISDIKSGIHKIIINWCKDDDGRDILYKNNGEERYPDFKLYKMIARKVNNHIPIYELQNKYFDKYIVSRKEIKKGSHIWNIDILPESKELSDNNIVNIN